MLRYSGESNMKRVALECGGKSPHVVMKDADIEAAAAGIAWGIYYNAGETCHAGSRVIVHESVKGQTHRSDREKSPPPSRWATLSSPRPQMGRPHRPGSHAACVGLHRQRHPRRAHTSPLAGNVLSRNSAATTFRPRFSTAYAPTWRVSREEIFGPVLTITSFAGEAEAIRLANDTIYGLAAAVWTSDMNVSHRLSGALRAGTVCG